VLVLGLGLGRGGGSGSGIGVGIGVDTIRITVRPRPRLRLGLGLGLELVRPGHRATNHPPGIAPTIIATPGARALPPPSSPPSHISTSCVLLRCTISSPSTSGRPSKFLLIASASIGSRFTTKTGFIPSVHSAYTADRVVAPPPMTAPEHCPGGYWWSMPMGRGGCWARRADTSELRMPNKVFQYLYGYSTSAVRVQYKCSTSAVAAVTAGTGSRRQPGSRARTRTRLTEKIRVRTDQSDPPPVLPGFHDSIARPGDERLGSHLVEVLGDVTFQRHGHSAMMSDGSGETGRATKRRQRDNGDSGEDATKRGGEDTRTREQRG
jgi:hypothetical protein